MEQFADSINKFLSFRAFKLLVGKVQVSRKAAIAKAESEYDIFNKAQRISSYLNRKVNKLLESK